MVSPKNRQGWPASLGLGLVVVTLLACGCAGRWSAAGRPRLVELACSTRQWTGVAISKDGRVFVSYPRGSEAVQVSVAELTPTGLARPFPDPEWNRWDPTRPPEQHFVCVHSVLVDQANLLWIVDAANPGLQGVVAGGPKLLAANLTTNRIDRTIRFDQTVTPAGCYLNDVRVDVARQYAYLTDSGLGALIVVDLTTGRARRRLVEHPSTKAENVAPVINGKPWRLADGGIPRVHADGLALDRTGEYLYYQALCGRSLYRVPTSRLRRDDLTEAQLADGVERLGETGPADGLEFDRAGDLYLTAVEDNAIKRFTPARRVETVLQDFRLAWPDSFALGPDGSLCITTSQIHLGRPPPQPCRLFCLRKQAWFLPGTGKPRRLLLPVPPARFE